MKNSVVLIRYVLLLWMLCGACHTLSIASAYDRTSPSASWGYQPLHGSAMSVNSSVYRGTLAGGTTATGIYTPASVQSGLFSKPTYQFQSTSAFINPSRLGASYVREEAVLRSSSWDGPGEEDDPIGEYNPMPIGDTPWLIMAVLAAGYIAIHRVRKRAHARVP